MVNPAPMDSALTELQTSDLDVLERIIHTRRATRRFRPDAIPDGLLERLIDLARWAPSGYNLQPTHFVVVTDPRLKLSLHRACLSQRQILEAPAVVVITGDAAVASNHLEDVLRMERKKGCITPEYEAVLRRTVPLAFGRGPVGLGWLWKLLLVPIVRAVRPLPSLPAVQRRFWLAKQTMLCAMNLMLAAEAAGLATVPMEGFDEGRVRKALGIPRSQVVSVVIAVGYPLARAGTKTRLPLDRILHHENWGRD